MRVCVCACVRACVCVCVGGGGGIPQEHSFTLVCAGLYRDVPLGRVWFLASLF